VLLFDDGRSFRLSSNGLQEARVFREDLEQPGLYLETRWLGMLPVLANPDARSLLMIGLGGSVALEAVPSTVTSLTVVELEQEVVAANRAIGALRGRDPLADPRVRLVVNDARGALQLTGAGFDAIVSQPSHPWTSGASHLYTREFFTLVREHLEPGGVFVQWIGLAFVDAGLLRSLVGTLVDVFPAVRVYQPTPGALLFLASGADLPVDVLAARALAASPGDFARHGVRLPEDVAAACVLGPDDARRFSERAPRITDDHNLLAARSAGLGPRALYARGLLRLLSPYPPVAPFATSLDPLYLVRRVAATSSAVRAERIALGLDDPVVRETAQGFAQLARGARLAAAGSFTRALALDPAAAEARFGRLAAKRPAVELGDPELLAEAARLPAAAAAVVAGWRAEALGDDAALRALDGELAMVSPREAAWRPAAVLRAAWRARSGDPARAAEALAMLDDTLVIDPAPAELLLRARAAQAAGRADVVLATLEDVAKALENAPRASGLARDGLAILALQPPAREARAAALRARLEQQLR
jgi:hypothetical protein